MPNPSTGAPGYQVGATTNVHAGRKFKLARDEIADGLSGLTRPGQTFEIRAIFKGAGARSEICHSVEEGVRAALSFKNAKGTYFTLNPLRDDLADPAKDADVVERTKILVDVDAVRSPDVPRECSATDDERTAAIELAGEIRGRMEARGWGRPTLIDSGNGGHLIYETSLPNDAASLDLVKAVLVELARRFDTDRAKVDTSVYNASRISKLPGTVVRKGDDSPERPHRMARMIEAGGDGETVTGAMLEALVAEGRPDRPRAESFKATATDGTTPEGRARAYLFSPGFPESIEGRRGHSPLYRAACELVDGFGLDLNQALPILREYNRARAHPPESDKQILHKISQAIKNHPSPSLKRLNADRPLSGGNGHRPSSNGDGRHHPQPPPAAGLITRRADSYRCRPVRFLDGGMLPAKLIVVAGLGGIGKGTGEAAIVADLTRGRPTLGLEYTPGGPIEVLMIGSEDGYEDTVVPRLAAAGADLSKVHFLVCATDDKGKRRPFSLGDVEALRRYLADHQAVKAVLIDPISGYVGRAGAKDNSEAEIRALLDPLIELADDKGVMILAIKHLNKDEGKTVASRVGGSVAYVNAPRVCYLVGKDPADEGRRVMAPFKWNLNTPRPKSIAWTLERLSDDEAEAIIKDRCDPGLDDDGKAQMKEQLSRVKWAGTCDVDAEDLLEAAGKRERKTPTNEFDRAEQWLRERLANGPVESLVVAKEGDEFLGKKWPEMGRDVTAEKAEIMRLGRVKWWRENILKRRLGGMSRQQGFRGAWAFELPIIPVDTRPPWTTRTGPATESATEATTESEGVTPAPVASVASVASVEPLNIQNASKQTINQLFPQKPQSPQKPQNPGVGESSPVVASVGGGVAGSYSDLDWRAPMDDSAF